MALGRQRRRRWRGVRGGLWWGRTSCAECCWSSRTRSTSASTSSDTPRKTPRRLGPRRTGTLYLVMPSHSMCGRRVGAAANFRCMSGGMCPRELAVMAPSKLLAWPQLSSPPSPGFALASSWHPVATANSPFWRLLLFEILHYQWGALVADGSLCHCRGVAVVPRRPSTWLQLRHLKPSCHVVEITSIATLGWLG